METTRTKATNNEKINDNLWIASHLPLPMKFNKSTPTFLLMSYKTLTLMLNATK